MQIDLKKVIEAVGKEKNLDKQLLIGALKEAILTSAKKHFGDCSFEAQFNEESEEIELFRYKVVVANDAVQNPLREMALDEALKLDESLQVGDEMGEKLPTDELGRISAQSARQVIVQKVQQAEKERIVKEFKEKKNQIVTGQVKRYDKQDIIVDLGAQEAVLPFREQIPMEKFKLRDKITCLLLDAKIATRGPQIVLSRANPEFLVRLFEQEVAEISEGTVVIQSCARDAGSRSKIAVFSNEAGVDPVGACVGVKGARVQAIVQELRGEKIDIIPYDRDPARFVCNALAPAEVSKVIVNERLHVMEVVVPDDHLSLAIGKRGQNVRLAAQLSGWKVDIRSESKMRELVQEHRDVLAQIPGLGEMRAEILVNEGYKDPSDIARMDGKTLCRLLRLTPEESDQVLAGATELAEKRLAKAAAESATEDEWDLILGGRGGDEEFTEAASEAAVELLVSKAKPTPQLDPEKVDPRGISHDILHYWMKVRGVGEHTAAVLSAAGFQNYQQLAETAPDEVAVKTGLPYKMSGKIHAEASKISGV